MEKKLNILILEDLPSDAELTKREVQKVIPKSVTKVVDTEKDYVQALRTFNPDMIISDYMMPTFDGMSALKIRMEKAKNIPFIMLTGSMNEEVAVKCMKAGADDYVIKGHIKRLGQAVISALEKKKINIRRQIAESENSKHTDDLTLINIINKAIIRGDSLPVIIKLLSIETKKYFNCKNTTIYLVSEDNKYLEMQNLYLPDSVAKPLEKIIGSHIPQIRIPLKNSSLSQKYLQANKPILTKDPETIQKWMLEFTNTTFLSDKLRQSIRKVIVPIYKLMATKSVITVPLVSEGKAVGLLDMSSKNTFTEDDMNRISSIAGPLTASIDRMRGEKKLAQANKTLYMLGETVSNMNECVSITDKDHNITFVNDSFLKTYGYKREEIIGKTFNAIQLKHDSELTSERRRKANLGGWKGEILNKKKDGTAFTIELSVTPLFDDNGKIIAQIGISTDITERKLVEKAIIDSEVKYRKFFAEDLTGDYLSTREGKIIDCNPEFLAIFGFKSLKDAQQYNAENLHGSKSIREEFIKRLEKKKKLANEISEVFRIDGEKVIIQENAIGEFDEAGKLINIRGYLFDITERVKAERELVKLSTAVEQSPVSIVITDTNGTIEYVNPIFGKITGYSLEETIGQNPRILKSGVYGESEYRKLWKTITNGKIWVGEFLNKKKNGELFWESATISPVIGKEGKTTHYLAVKEDITEHKNNISELMDREEKYRTLTQNLNTGVYRNTPGKNGRFLEVNPAFIKMFGFRNRNELDRFKVADLYPDPAEREIIEKELNLKGFLLNEEIQLRKKDGTLFYASISATSAKNEIGAVMHYDGIIEDITERKTMMDQIIKERDKSQLYLDIAGVMFLALDRRGNILLANQKTCEIVGVKEEDLIGNNWADSYLPKDIRLDVKNVFNKLINDKGKSAQFFENEIITANGEKRLISWHNNNLLDESGNIYGIISSGLDITEQKEAEELREKLYETSRYLTESLDINIVLKQISNQAMSLLKCSSSMVYMLDDDNKTINPVMAYYPPYTDKVMSTKLSIDNSLTGQTVKAKTGKMFNYNDNVKGAHHIQGTPEEDRDNIIISPFIIDGKVIGTLNLIRLEIPFTEKDLQIVNTFAIYASTAIKNAKNHQRLQHEIDERMQTEELLKESHNRYESIFDGAADGIIYIDWDGNIVSVNPAAENLLDTSMEKMVGNNAVEIAKSLLSGESLDRMLEFIKKTLMGEVISDFLVKTDKKEFEFDTPRKKEKLGLTIMIRDVTERNKSRAKLVVHQNNLQLLTNELTMTEEKARRRLAITLHDKLGQSLVLAKFKTDELMKLTKDSKQNKVIDEITTFLEEAIKESRNITYELSPPVLYEMGLVSAVSWKLEEIEKSNKVKTSLIDGSKSYKFEKREEIILYRTINELLQNTIKHAKAKIVKISFILFKNNYRITVSDDGVGFNLEMMKNMAISDKKFGIFSIMERIRYIGGEVTIDTALKKGTKIIINMPIKN